MSPTLLLLRLAMIFVAFKAGNQNDRPLIRVIGLGYLVAVGILTIFAGTGGAGHLYWAIGSGMLILASYTYWTNR
jgi:hypothetical protein